jgi:acetyltransferase-like isoleucine patch superfamily enzyme
MPINKPIDILRKLLSMGRRARNFVKRHTIFGTNVDIHPTVSICWSASLDPARGRIAIGRHSSVHEGVILRAYGGLIDIGEHCTINPYCYLHGGGNLVIGNGVRIAAHTSVIAANHIFDDPGQCIYQQGEIRKGIIIEDDVWIGAGAKILDGVTIKQGTVVGAGAVVTKSTEPYSIVVGVPAKPIASRLK